MIIADQNNKVFHSRRSTAADAAETITPNKADKLFHMRKGTAIAACRAGIVKCRPWRNFGFDSFKISLTDARRLWGVQ